MKQGSNLNVRVTLFGLKVKKSNNEKCPLN